jgi:hypothetical protein
MKQQVLQTLGFNPIQRHSSSTIKQVEPSPTTISVHAQKDSSQLRIKIPRDIMQKMHWELSHRVKVLVNKEDNTLAIIRARANDKESFKIGFQSGTRSTAMDRNYSGLIRLAWREEMFGTPISGVFDTSLTHDRSTILIQIPQQLVA